MIWLVPNNLFWLVSVNHFWLVNGLGPVRSDSGVFVCDRFFAFGNSRLFPERGSLMSDSEMNGARFDMANKDVILSFELRLFWSRLLHCIDKYLWHQRLHSWNAVFAVPWSSCVIGLKWRHQSGVGADSMLTLSLILMTYTEIREHWLTWPVVPSVVPQNKLPQNNREYKLAKDVNCLTNNVVYLLECTRCKKQYVGETKRNFLTRFKEHLADIRHNRDTPVAKHFNLNSHKTAATPAQPIPTILSRIAGHPDRTTDVRKNKEKMWIHTLRSTAPHGINVRE